MSEPEAQEPERPCMRCGSVRLITKAHILDRGPVNIPVLELTLQVYRNPNAFFFRGGKTTTVYARVCGDCGHVELFVEEADKLYKAQEKAQEQKKVEHAYDPRYAPEEPAVDLAAQARFEDEEPDGFDALAEGDGLPRSADDL